MKNDPTPPEAGGRTHRPADKAPNAGDSLPHESFDRSAPATNSGNAAPGGHRDDAAPADYVRTASEPSGRTHIRSFIHRRAHITPSQREAIDRLMPLWALPFQRGVLDFAQVFGRDAPTILEIGFGMGETTEKIALARPEDNFLGVEVFNAGVGAMLKRIDESGLTNVRVIQHDAVEVLNDMIAPESLAGVHIYFADPWPKKRHHKRRLIQPPLVRLLSTRMKPGAYIHLATDWQDYAEQMLEVLSNEASLENTVGEGYAPRPDFRPQTKFETRGLRLGHGVWDLIFKRRA